VKAAQKGAQRNRQSRHELEKSVGAGEGGKKEISGQVPLKMRVLATFNMNWNPRQRELVLAPNGTDGEGSASGKVLPEEEPSVFLGDAQRMP